MSSRTIAISITILFVVAVIVVAQPKGGRTKWVEPAGLTEMNRIDGRPGNYHVLSAVTSFLDGMYELEPIFPNVAFPFSYNGTLVKSALELDRQLVREFQKGEQAVNKRRRYTYEVRSVLVYNLLLESHRNNLKQKLDEEKIGDKELLESQRRHEKGSKHSVCVLLHTELYSLQSDKIAGEGKGGPLLFHLILKDGKWRVASYYED